MSLKKSLKRGTWKENVDKNPSFKKQGQSTIEYFILLTVMATLTLLATSSLMRNASRQTEQFVNRAVEHIVE